MQTPLNFNIWVQSDEEFVNAKNNIKPKNLNTVFANISTTKYLWHPTHSSWSWSHICKRCFTESLLDNFLYISSGYYWNYSLKVAATFVANAD